MCKRIFIVILSILCLSALARYIYMEEVGNFHAVEEGVLYRSAQLDKDELVKYIDKYQIKSILNLRGKKQGSQWYKEEIQVAKQKGIKFLVFHLSPKKKVSPIQLEKIISLINRAPKPILIHCKAGADRAGLIAAVWKLRQQKETPQNAYKQLSIYYGHFPYLWSKTKAMDQSFWNYVEYLRSQKEKEKEAQNHRVLPIFLQLSSQYK